MFVSAWSIHRFSTELIWVQLTTKVSKIIFPLLELVFIYESKFKLLELTKPCYYVLEKDYMDQIEVLHCG